MNTRDLKEPRDSRAMQILVIVAFFVVLLAVMNLLGRMTTPFRYQVLSVADNWRVSYHGATYQDVALDQLTFHDLRQRDKVRLSVTLPDLEVPSGCVFVKTGHSAIRAYVDDVPVYEYGAEYAARGVMTPSWHHFVPLPADYGLKTLTLELTAAEDSAFSSIEPVFVGNIDDVFTMIQQSQAVTAMVGGFLCVLFIVLFFVFLYLALFVRVEWRIFFAGLVSLELGVYMLAYYEVLGYYRVDASWDTWLEYGALFTLPTAIGLLVASLREGLLKKIAIALAVFDLVMAFVVLVLHLTHTVYADAMLPLEHAIFFTEGCFILAETFYRAWKSRSDMEIAERWKTSDKALVFGMGLMLVFTCLEIIRYNVLRRAGQAGGFLQNFNFLAIAALIFIVSLLLNVFYYNMEHATAAQTASLLTGLAYTDPLTELANRGRCEQVMEEIVKEDEPYTVISLDIDDLKETNDRYSHAEGDRLLMEFAAILRGAFEGARLIGRMGGDEFLVILPDTSMVTSGSAINHLQKAIADKNEESDHLTFGVSYGIAYSHEKSSRAIKDVVALADLRMYRMKRERHKLKRSAV